MNKWFIFSMIIVIAAWANSCNKLVTTNEVIQIKADSTMLQANGSSNCKVYAFLPLAATTANRTVLFTTSSGTFGNHKDTMSAFADSIGVVSNMWAAVVTYTASLMSGPAKIYASTQTAPVFTDTTHIMLTPSVPDSIVLQASSFMVEDSFQSEITLTATLFAAKGKKVSLGTAVTFYDYFEKGGVSDPVHGSYRASQLLSDTNSTVSCIYNPGPIRIGEMDTFIVISATVVSNPKVISNDTIFIPK